MTDPTESTPDSASEALPPVRAVALQLAHELGGYERPAGMPQEFPECLSQSQRILISDTYGLLKGISNGMITTSQPRIQQNLVRIVTELAENADSEIHRQLSMVLGTVLSRAGAFGLTADHEPMTNRVRQRGS